MYNASLCRARFALCPAGAGPNTLRLWEALAVGSVPVLLGHHPRLPDLSDACFGWDDALIRYHGELRDLPRYLAQFSMDEVRRRQQLCQQAYRAMRVLRCF